MYSVVYGNILFNKDRIPSSSHAGGTTDNGMNAVGEDVGGDVGDTAETGADTIEEAREDEGDVGELVGVTVGAAVGPALVNRSRSSRQVSWQQSPARGKSRTCCWGGGGQVGVGGAGGGGVTEGKG